MIFDNIIMNPPYGSRTTGTSLTLHYNITKVAIKYLKNNSKCICLMPTTLITSSVDTKAIKEIKKDFDSTLLSIEEIDGNKYFDTSMRAVGIYEFDTNKKTDIKIETLTGKKEIVKSLFDFNYRKNDLDISILNKINANSIAINRRSYFRLCKKEKQDKILLDNCINAFFNGKHVAEYDIFIAISSANGGMNAQWQSIKLANYGIIKKENLPTLLKNNVSSKAFIGFKTSELKSAQNILKLIKTNCLRYPLLKMQDDQNMCPRVYKYFPDIDYTNIDTEEKFYKFFNITPEEQKIIEDTMEKYR